MSASWIVAIHLADHREPLTRRATDYDIGRDSGRRRSVKHVVADDVIAEVATVGLASPGVNLVCPNDVEAGSTEPVVEPACA